MKGTSKKEPNNKKKEFTFPPQEEMEKVIKRFSDPNYRRVNKRLKPDATTVERFKYQLCKSIAGYRRENNLSEKKLVEILDITQPKLEYILFCHLNQLNVEELIDYTESLKVPVEVKINYEGEKASPRTHRHHHR